ncbi:Cysteine desulfurase NFS1 [Ceraceosorus bombacis]|uniref:Cysteine desulfurase NFS1 n=1 Tax=Ceraceosorus bombacis TaxID=401625 RepID=A0A0P1BEZ4_9BASI|nr:Cysteine desulfurase NFS1 [Ceraceosorus bombacis]
MVSRSDLRSYGACPIPVLEAWRALSDKAEENPDLFLLRTRDELSQSALSRLSKMLNCPTSTLALIPNATTATNAVLRDLYFQDGDGILTLNVGYGAVNKTLSYVYETHTNLKTKLHDVLVPIKLPASDDEILRTVEESIVAATAKQIKIRLGIFDAISSMPGIKLPWVELVQLLRKHDILSFVDGAHAFAQIPLDLQAADPDFFVSNIHKWGYAHRGCAVFYVPRRNQHLQRSSLPTSWSYVENASGQTNTWAEQWAANGLIDQSSFLSVDAALTFAEKLGGYERLRRYTHDLARKGALEVARILGSELLDPDGERTAAMVNVRVPVAAHCTQGEVDKWFAAARPWFWNTLQDEFKTAIPLYTYDSKIWARFSAQAWLEVSDFEWGARALKELVRRVNVGEVKFVDGKAVESSPSA